MRCSSHRSTVCSSHHMRLRSSLASSVIDSRVFWLGVNEVSIFPVLRSFIASFSWSDGGVIGTSFPNFNFLASDHAASHQLSDAALHSLSDITIAKCMKVATSSSPSSVLATVESQRNVSICRPEPKTHLGLFQIPGLAYQTFFPYQRRWTHSYGCML